jgi:WD40 repeat protein
MTYDFHLNLVATGSSNGEVTLYDFELSRIIGILIDHKGQDDEKNSSCTALEFLSPYPLLASASFDCTVSIWGVRGCPLKLYNVCLICLKNNSWDS